MRRYCKIGAISVTVAVVFCYLHAWTISIVCSWPPTQLPGEVVLTPLFAPPDWPPKVIRVRRVGKGVVVNIFRAGGRVSRAGYSTLIGWPIATHKIYWVADASAKSTWDSGILFRKKQGAHPTNWKLPTRPDWPGFVLWTTTTAVLLFLVITGCSALRRYYRFWRRMCIHCGYPRSDVINVCSECGYVYKQ